MLTLLFWLMALALFAGATRLGRHFGVIPIVSQLLLASIGLPLLMLLWVEPHWQLSGAQLVTPGWLKTLYSLSFALLLGHILSDVIDLRIDRLRRELVGKVNGGFRHDKVPLLKIGT